MKTPTSITYLVTQLLQFYLGEKLAIVQLLDPLVDVRGHFKVRNKRLDFFWGGDWAKADTFRGMESKVKAAPSPSKAGQGKRVGGT